MQDRNINRYNDEVEIDLKDLLAELFAKAGIIILCMAVFGATVLGFVLFKDRNSVVAPLEERIGDARIVLSTEDAETAERIYQQYLSYTKYKESLQKYYSDNLFIDGDFSDYVQELVLYNVSSSISGADDIFISLTISRETYERISQVFQEEDMPADIYKLATISSGSENALVVNDDADTRNSYMLTVSVIGRTREQCDQVRKLVEDDLNKQFAVLQSLDPSATLIYVGENYNEDLASWIMERQAEAIRQLNDIENTIKNFNNNQVSNLSSEQKSYYNLLLEEDDVLTSGRSLKSLLKYLILGLFVGAALPCGWILLKYLFDGKVKTPYDVTARYGIPVLNTVAVDSKKRTLFTRWIKKLKGINPMDREKTLDLISTDICTIMAKNELNKIFLVKTSGSDEEERVAEGMEKRLNALNPEMDVKSGEPQISAEAIRNLSDSDGVILLAECGKTSVETADQCWTLLGRYSSNVLGSVVLNRA